MEEISLFVNSQPVIVVIFKQIMEANKNLNKKLISWIRIIMIITGYWDRPISSIKFINRCLHVYSVGMRASCFLFWIFLTTELIRLIIFDYPEEVIVSSVAIVVTQLRVITRSWTYLKHNTLDIFSQILDGDQEKWVYGEREIEEVYRRKTTFLNIGAAVFIFADAMTVISLDIIGNISVNLVFCNFPEIFQA